MRVFSKISPRIWEDMRFRSLQGDRERLYYLFTMTSRHQNSSGACRLPDEYAAADLGWSVDEVESVREGVKASGMIHFDGATDEVFVDRWFESNPAQNDKHAKGVAKGIKSIQSTDIRETATRQLKEAEERRPADNRKKETAAVMAKAAENLSNGQYLGTNRLVRR